MKFQMIIIMKNNVDASKNAIVIVLIVVDQEQIHQIIVKNV